MQLCETPQNLCEPSGDFESACGKPTGWIFSLKFYHVGLEINPMCFIVTSFGLTPPLWLF